MTRNPEYAIAAVGEELWQMLRLCVVLAQRVWAVFHYYDRTWIAFQGPRHPAADVELVPLHVHLDERNWRD